MKVFGVFIVLVTILAGVDCIDRRKAAMTPIPAVNFDLHSFAHGRWYTHFRYLACGFSGSQGFSDAVTDSVLDGETVKQQMTWRDGLCATFATRLTPVKGGGGAFIQRDPFGGMLTGDHVVVIYNREKDYHISWGCTKRDVDGKCADFRILFKTRKPFPEKHVLESVIKDLKKLWDVSLTEMVFISHKNAC